MKMFAIVGNDKIIVTHSEVRGEVDNYKSVYQKKKFNNLKKSTDW